MRYVDGIKLFISETLEKEIRSDIKRRQASDVRSGKMSNRQRIARIYSTAMQRGDDKRANMLLQLYKKLGG